MGWLRKEDLGDMLVVVEEDEESLLFVFWGGWFASQTLVAKSLKKSNFLIGLWDEEEEG